MNRILYERLDRDNIAPKLKVKKSQYVNNPRLKEKIRVGEPVFKREVRHD